MEKPEIIDFKYDADIMIKRLNKLPDGMDKHEALKKFVEMIAWAERSLLMEKKDDPN